MSMIALNRSGDVIFVGCVLSMPFQKAFLPLV